MLSARVLTAVLLLGALLAALLLLPPAQWGVLVALVTALAAWEWGRLAGLSAGGCGTYAAALGMAAGAVVFVPEAAHMVPALLWIAALFWGLAAPLVLAARRPLPGAARAAAGWIVLLPTAAALHQLRLEGPYLLLGFMATVWVSDTAAYFAGRRFGRRKLAPSVSPGKTWEGAAGAMLAVAAYGAAWGRWGLDMADPARLAVFVGFLLVLAMLGIVGDLFESLMKRQAGVKDSGRVLPGHGGILDRVDALTATLPVAALAFPKL